MLRLAFDFIIAWREIRARPNAYNKVYDKTVDIMLTISIRYPAIFIFLCPSIYVLPYKDTPNLLFESGILFLECEGCEKLKRGH